MTTTFHRFQTIAIAAFVVTSAAGSAMAQDRFEHGNQNYRGGVPVFGGYYDTFGGYGGTRDYSGYSRTPGNYSSTAGFFAIPLNPPTSNNGKCASERRRALAVGSSQNLARLAACRRAASR
jgi:hypothetical protein